MDTITVMKQCTHNHTSISKSTSLVKVVYFKPLLNINNKVSVTDLALHLLNSLTLPYFTSYSVSVSASFLFDLKGKDRG